MRRAGCGGTHEFRHALGHVEHERYVGAGCAADADEHWDDPPKDLARALEAEALPSSFLRTVPFGATQDIRM